MRTLLISAGLCLAATAVSASPTLELVTRTDTNLTLANGCVYAPNAFAQDKSWTFVHANSATRTICPLTVSLKTSAPVSGKHVKPNYLVGVYR